MEQQLINEANKLIKRLYDGNRHTVAAALLCGSGKIYTAVNMFSLPLGTCAEPIVLGKAISEGEKVFVKVACVRGLEGEILAPCGNCRQVLHSFAPDIEIVLNNAGEIKSIPIKDLLPFAYKPID